MFNGKFGETSDPHWATDAYGWALVATHASAWLFFADTRILNALPGSEPFCWPYFESCWQWRLQSAAHVMVLQMVYLLVGLGSAAALWHRQRRAFWWILLALNLALFATVSLDYRLRANEFYMLFAINGVYLFASRPRWSVSLIIISCYFWAGVLKLNYEWLSGAVLYRDLWLIPKAWVPAACAYVVVLEMVMIWGLLSRRARIFVPVFVQLLLFHVQSLSQIHWFYPLLMAAILSWFIVERVGGMPSQRVSVGMWFRGHAPLETYIIVGVFSVLQLVPALYRGDSALTGQGRIFALHMFEARQLCDVSASPIATEGESEIIDLKINSLAPRMVCDPVVYFSRAHSLCRTRRTTDPRFDFRLVMRAKRTTDAEFQIIVDEPAFCAANHEYRLFSNNDWLR